MKRRTKQPAPANQSYVFEIADWQPSFGLSVNHDRYRDVPYHEFVSIKCTGVCIHPDALKGRKIDLDIAGGRDLLEPDALKRDPNWKPLCIGELETHPSGGRFWFSVPHDDLPFILTAFAHGLFRYISLWGPAVKRGKSLCTSVHLMRSVDPDVL